MDLLRSSVFYCNRITYQDAVSLKILQFLHRTVPQVPMGHGFCVSHGPLSHNKQHGIPKISAKCTDTIDIASVGGALDLDYALEYSVVTLIR